MGEMLLSVVRQLVHEEFERSREDVLTSVPLPSGGGSFFVERSPR